MSYFEKRIEKAGKFMIKKHTLSCKHKTLERQKSTNLKSTKKSIKKPNAEQKPNLPNRRPSISKIQWDTLLIDILAFDTNCELERLALNNRFIFRMEYLYALGSVECYTPLHNKIVGFLHTISLLKYINIIFQLKDIFAKTCIQHKQNIFCLKCTH